MSIPTSATTTGESVLSFKPSGGTLVKPIAKYIQALALKPGKAPDQSEYEQDYGGTQSWYKDAADWATEQGVNVSAIKRNLRTIGAKCDYRYSPEPDTAGMRRQYFLDCVRRGEVLPIDP